MFLDADTGEVQETHACKLEIGHRGDRYSQRNTYTWPDGRVEVHDFPGVFDGGELRIDSKDLAGYCKELSEDTIMFYASYKKGSHREGVDVWDLIRLTSETQRYRTRQIKGGEKVVRLCHVDEHRTSSANAFIPQMHVERRGLLTGCVGVTATLQAGYRPNKSRVLGPPPKGIGGMFEMVIGCSSKAQLEEQVKYWGLFGFSRNPDETPDGSLDAQTSEMLYGVRSELVSVRLFHMASRSDHGLVRLIWFSEIEALPSFVPQMSSLRCKGARWGTLLSSNLYNVMNHAQDAFEAGADVRWKGPHRSVVYKLDDDSVGSQQSSVGMNEWSATSACVRECVILQPMAVQNVFQRYEYTIPNYGQVDPESKFLTSQITHFGLISQGDYSEISFYVDVLGLLKVTPGDEGKLFTFEEAEPGDRDILGLDSPGDQFHTLNVDSPESSTNVKDYVSGRLHILRYSNDIPSDVGDFRAQSRPGTCGPCNYTLRVADIDTFYRKVSSAPGVSEVTSRVLHNEFGERSFSFVAPDGYFWTMVETL